MSGHVEHGQAVPRPSGHVVVLPRIRRVLNQWAPVTLVRGMTGYGKTTQVAAWLWDLRPAPEFLWLNGTVGDVSAILSAWIAQNPPATGLEEAPSGQEPSGRTVIVIDDAHRLTDQAGIDQMMALLSHRSDVHVVAISRGRTRLQVAADGRTWMNTIPGGELLFRPAETAALAEQLGVPLTRAHLDRLHDEFGGWPAAVRIVLNEMRSGASDLPITRAERYLRHTVLPQLADSRLLRLSMRFALAERLTHRLIRDLAEDSSPQDTIDVLEGPGYTDIRHLADDVELVLPRFVRRTLRREFTAADPQAARAMHQRLASWYRTRPGPQHDLHALHHARVAADWTMFESVWVAAGTALAASHPDEIENVLRDLPTPVLKRHPSIAVIRDSLAARRTAGTPAGQWVAARREFARLSATVDSRSIVAMPLPDMLVVGSGQMLDLRRRGKYAEVDALAADLDTELAHRQEAGEPEGDALAGYYLQRGVTDLLRLHYADAARWYRLSWHHRQPADLASTRSTASGLALVDAMTGRYQDADTWIRRHQTLTGEPDPSCRITDIRIAIAAQLAAADRLQADPGASREIWSSAADSEFWAFAAYAQARWELTCGRAIIGLDIVERARQGDPRDGNGSAAVLLLRVTAELLIASGQGHRALQLLEDAPTDSQPILAVPLAWLRLLSDDAATARHIATRALYLESATAVDRAELILVGAVAALRQGHRQEAFRLFGQAATLADGIGALRLFTLPSRTDLTTLLAGSGHDLPEAVRARLDCMSPVYPESISLISLTPREEHLALALRHSASRDEIARQMFVSINTVKKQLVTLYRKLGVTTRTDALIRLEHLGLMPSEGAAGLERGTSRSAGTSRRARRRGSDHAGESRTTSVPPQSRRSAREVPADNGTRSQDRSAARSGDGVTPSRAAGG